MYDKSDFSKGSIVKHILYLSIPMTISQVVQMLYNLVDRIYIGHIDQVSGLALTGLGLTFPIVTIIMAFTNLFGMGGAPLFAIARGASDDNRAAVILNTTFTMLLITSIFLMIIFYLFLQPILYLLGASTDSFGYAYDYLLVYLIGTPLLMSTSGMTGFINAQGFSVTSMVIVLSGVIINIILDPIFIFTFGFGVTGAALATVISQVVSFILLIAFFRGSKTLFKISLKSFIVNKIALRRILALGLSGFTFQATNSAVQIACNVTLSQFGGDLYIGIMAVLTSIRDFVSAPLIGLTNGTQPVISYNYGAKKLSRVKSSIRFVTVTSVVLMVLIWILLLIFPKQVIGLFSSSPEIIEEGSKSMFIYFFGFFMMAFQFCGQTTFTGLNFAKQAVFFSLFRKIVIVVPLTLILPHLFGLGADGVFLAEPLSNFIGGLACYCTMLYSVNKLFKETANPNNQN